MASETWEPEDYQRFMRGEHVPRKVAGKASQVKSARLPEPAKGQRRVRGTMNKNEQRYAAELSRLEREGLIRWWEFEVVKVRLADNTYICPDFAVITSDGFLEFHDAKGAKGKRYWCEEDAKIKLKVLAERFPARVKIVWQGKSGVWESETL